MKTTRTTAEGVREGDFLPDLDNGYVFEVGPAEEHVTGRGLGNPFVGMVYIGFHDREGEEQALILNPDHPIVVGEYQ